MCLILFAYDCHPRYQLVVAANRDEFYNRPTLPVAFWQDNRSILAGRDLQQGGTWMGITTAGAFAALTNYRGAGPNDPHAPSRGHLVQDFLNCQESPEGFINSLPNGGAAYNGFSLLLGTTKALNYYSNREKAFRKVEKGIHGLSNSLLDVPWPKVRKGTEAFASCLQGQELDKEQLFAIMEDQAKAEDYELPQTGLSLEWERLLSSIHIVSADYGTRSTSVLLVDRNSHVQFWERSFRPVHPGEFNEVYYEFTIDDKGSDKGR